MKRIILTYTDQAGERRTAHLSVSGDTVVELRKAAADAIGCRPQELKLGCGDDYATLLVDGRTLDDYREELIQRYGSVEGKVVRTKLE